MNLIIQVMSNIFVIMRLPRTHPRRNLRVQCVILNLFQDLKNMFRKGNYYAYILTNNKHSVFYIGVTKDLERRMYEHKEFLIEGFSKKYKLTYLVYYELYSDIKEAIAREKQLKNWHREWKINLIKSINPLMKDLAAS